MSAMERTSVVFDKILNIFMAIAACLVILDALMVTVDVVLRYSFKITWAGLLEITEYSLLWMTFLGTAWIMRKNTHIRADLLLNLLTPRSKLALNIIASVISVILLAGLTWFTAKLTLFDIQTRFTIASILQPIKWPIEIVIPVGFFFLLIQTVRNLYHNIAEIRDISTRARETAKSTSGGKT